MFSLEISESHERFHFWTNRLIKLEPNNKNKDETVWWFFHSVEFLTQVSLFGSDIDKLSNDSRPREVT